MKDKKIILAPAKLNIFLKILGRRFDGYHEIRSGVTFINLFDQIEIELNHKTTISYSGIFKPEEGIYDDCIIERTLNFLNIRNKIQLKIKIIKNIPVQGGLGSASTNAASLIIALKEMHLIEYKKPEYYSSLGADVPCFLFKRDCLINGIGNKISYYSFPKYFFLLVKPQHNNSTKEMYNKLDVPIFTFNESKDINKIQINDEDFGNDFEKIIFRENRDFKIFFDFLKNLDYAIFTRVTGSGSCCYVAFEKKEQALNSLQILKDNYPKFWTVVVENIK